MGIRIPEQDGRSVIWHPRAKGFLSPTVDRNAHDGDFSERGSNVRLASHGSRERDILEHAVHTIAKQAVKADELVGEAKDASGGDHPVTVHAKMLRLELLKVKANLERELEDFVLDCSKCGRDVHWVSGLGVSPGQWAHREPAPHGEPAV